MTQQRSDFYIDIQKLTDLLGSEPQLDTFANGVAARILLDTAVETLTPSRRFEIIKVWVRLVERYGFNAGKRDAYASAYGRVADVLDVLNESAARFKKWSEE